MYAATRLAVGDDNGETVLKYLIMTHEDFSEAYALLGVHYLTLKMFDASNVMLHKGNV